MSVQRIRTQTVETNIEESTPLQAPAIPEEVIRRYAYKNRLSLETAQTRFQALQEFLDEAAGRSLDPSSEIDAVWHEFILHTKLYRSYCESRYGRLVDHIPTSPILMHHLSDELIPTSKAIGQTAVTNSDRRRDCSSDCHGRIADE